MKRYIALLTLLFTLSIGSQIFAFDTTFSNKTDKYVVLNLRAGKNYEQEIAPGQTHTFKTAGCLDKVVRYKISPRKFNPKLSYQTQTVAFSSTDICRNSAFTMTYNQSDKTIVFSPQ